MTVPRFYAAGIFLLAAVLATGAYFVLERDVHDESLRVLATILPLMMAVGSAPAAWRCLTTRG